MYWRLRGVTINKIILRLCPIFHLKSSLLFSSKNLPRYLESAGGILSRKTAYLPKVQIPLALKKEDSEKGEGVRGFSYLIRIFPYIH